MFDSVSASAASGLAAAARKAESAADNIANSGARSSLPVGEAANANLSGGPPENLVPARVEQPAGNDADNMTSDWPIKPPYIPIAESARATSQNNAPPAPETDLATDVRNLTEAEQSFKANARTVQSIQDLVRQLYDLPR